MKEPTKDEVIQGLKNKLLELRKNLSTKRKNGEYTKLAEIMLTNLPSKIRLAETDYQKAYVDEVNNVFKAVEDDLNTKYP